MPQLESTKRIDGQGPLNGNTQAILHSICNHAVTHGPWVDRYTPLPAIAGLASEELPELHGGEGKGENEAKEGVVRPSLTRRKALRSKKNASKKCEGAWRPLFS